MLELIKNKCFSCLPPKKKNGADAGFPRSTSVCLVSRKPPFSYPLPVLPLSLEDLIGGTRN